VNRAAVSVFNYSNAPHVRRHGPLGYLDYKHYKPWLRDEFSFRCVYCLCREKWFPDGDAYFAIDHVSPRSRTPGPLTAYDDLVYACCMCNAFKKDFPAALDCSTLTLAEHLEVREDGTVRELTSTGKALIELCALDRPGLVAFRRDLLALLALLAKRRGGEAERVRRRYLGYPDDLPDLASLRPPDGNSRPEGIAESSFERRRRGNLPEAY
jgi:hypothetical protein